MMQTTQEPRAKTRNVETVLNHQPLLDKDNKPRQESWANFGLAYYTENGRAFLQPGQFLPVWQFNNRWRHMTPFHLSVMSAFVVKGRYMIRGGDKKLGSHPEILEWEEGTPLRGIDSELRFPGGARKLAPKNLPMLAASGGSFEKRPITARAFHDSFGMSTLHQGSPLALVCRTDKATESNLPFNPIVVYDILFDEVTTAYQLPLPIITSDEEEVVLAEYPETWMTAMCDMLAKFGITEVGVVYQSNTDDIVETRSAARPLEVYRNSFSKNDLGVSTLDAELYERMLPFSTGRFDIDILTGV